MESNKKEIKRQYPRLEKYYGKYVESLESLNLPQGSINTLPPTATKHPYYPIYFTLNPTILYFEIEKNLYYVFNKFYILKTRLKNKQIDKRYQIHLPKINGINRKSLSIHRLLAETYIPNPNNEKYVYAKDNNPLNLSVENFMWGGRINPIRETFCKSCGKQIYSKRRFVFCETCKQEMKTKNVTQAKKQKNLKRYPNLLINFEELSDKEKDMVDMYLNGDTYQKIGNKYSLSRERVRQILDRINTENMIKNGEDVNTYTTRKSSRRRKKKIPNNDLYSCSDLCEMLNISKTTASKYIRFLNKLNKQDTTKLVIPKNQFNKWMKKAIRKEMNRYE